MGVRIRATLFVLSAMSFPACGESFTTSVGSGGSGGTAGSGDIGGGSGGGAGGAGGEVTTAGAGGVGGTTCDPVDDDGDGASECDGDCDDAAPEVGPNMVEICGDGIDGNCDGKDDDAPPCNGVGTFVSQKHGTVGASGTADDPVATIAEGIEKAQQIGVPTAVLVSAGSYAETLVLTGGISLVGGFDPESWAVRDPVLHETVLKSTSFDGLRIVGAIAPLVVDGLQIHGRAVQSGADSSVAVTVDGGDATLSHNVLLGGAVNAGPGASVGVRVIAQNAGGGHARLSDNSISGGSSAGGPTYGVVVDSDAMEVDLVSNDVVAGPGTDSVALLVVSSAGVVVKRNTLQSRAAKGSASSPSVSLGLWVQRGPLLADGNLVNPDQLDAPPECFTPEAWCGGARISTPQATLVNNILAGSSSSRSAGIQLIETDESLENVVVSSNLVLAGGHVGAGNRSAAVVLAAPVPSGGTLALIGRFRNNIFFGGIAETNHGFLELPVPNEPCDPAALDHNLFHFPVQAPKEGILYGDWTGAAAVNLTLGALPGDGDNLFEDPKLESNHLAADSPCRNAGTELDAPARDRDEDERPEEGYFDIGPDELVPSK